jgi:lysophospholipid acyltransferase (LPLAT)-like uncharacterized protein
MSIIKKITKHQYFYTILGAVIYLYLRIVYLTTKWVFVMPSDYTMSDFKNARGTVFVMWHNNLAIAPYAFRDHKNLHSLVSPHSDGKIIAIILRLFGYKIIEGSTNKNSMSAVKEIMHHLKTGDNIAITPDGPRGPLYKVNSNIAKIAEKTQSKIIPINVSVDKCIRFNSWDKLALPLPFGNGIVTLGGATKYESRSIE